MTAAEQALRVLVVDDEAPARNRLRDLLADCAVKMPLEIAGEAATGRQALEMLPACEADVVLLDIRMPDMDGIETAQHIQKFDDPPVVIFTTAYDAYALKAFEVHAIDYLLKPIRLSRHVGCWHQPIAFSKGCYRIPSMKPLMEHSVFLPRLALP